MTQQEFTERTGYTPTIKQFDIINAEYMESDKGKDEFCASWKRKGGIAAASREALIENVNLTAQVAELEMRLMKVQYYLNDTIFSHFDKIDALDDKNARRSYLYELHKKLQTVFCDGNN